MATTLGYHIDGRVTSIYFGDLSQYNRPNAPGFVWGHSQIFDTKNHFEIIVVDGGSPVSQSSLEICDKSYEGNVRNLTHIKSKKALLELIGNV